MTEIEAQKWLERFEWDDSEETSEALATICEALQEYPKFKAIGTIEEFKALKEKNVAKKPIKHDSYYVCPCCGNTEIEYCNEVDCRTIRLKRCTLCEQKLDWSE